MMALRFRIALLGVLVTVLAIPGAVHGAPPSNDNFASATTVTNLPFTDTVANIAEATAELGEPGSCTMGDRNVWYSLTPTEDGVVRASANATFYYTSLRIFRADGPGIGGLTWVDCQTFGQSIAFEMQAGSTYYLQAGNFLSSIAVFPWDTLRVDLSLVPPPANDDFADAARITTLPFTHRVDVTGATAQPGDPSLLCGGDLRKSIWYRFTPRLSRTFSVSPGVGGGGGGINVFTGASLDSLTRVACGSSATGSGAFQAIAGTTYYLQAGTWLSGGSFETRVELTPPPAVGFIWGPSFPTRFDIITFQGQYLDPIGIDSWAWSFGDGATGIGQYPQHQYAQDGDYSVTVTVTTPDGRTNSATQIVQVRTPPGTTPLQEHGPERHHSQRDPAGSGKR